MSGAHTSGPWLAVHDTDDGGWIIGCDDFLGRHIAYLSNGGVPEDEEPGNACLIASAPDLLEVAQRAAAVIKSMDGIIGNVEERDNPWNYTLRSLRAAIAKATSLRPVGDA